MEPVGQPGCGIDIKIPADGIRPIGSQGLKGIHGIALGLAHLLSVLILHVAQHNHILIGRLVKQQGGLCHQGMEPPAGLIHCLGDKLCRKLLLKQLLVLKGIVMLRKGHGPAVKPAVDHLRHPAHGLAAIRAGKGNCINVGAVQLYLGILRPSAALGQLPAASDGLLAPAALTLPDIQGRTPIAVPGNGPILDVLQPVAEAALANGLRNPVHRIVVAYQILPHCRLLDVPGLSGIVDQRRITAPAMGILVLEPGGVKEKACLLKILKHHGICLLHKYPGIAGLLCHLALAIDKLNKGKVILPSHLGVILTEGRRNVNNTGTICHGDIIGAGYKICPLALFCYRFPGKIKQRHIFLILQIRALKLFHNLVPGRVLIRCQRTQHLVQ